MSTNDTLVQTSPSNQFDVAIVRALRKNPQGLRYCDLLKRSGEEYKTLHFGLRRRKDTENELKDGNGINVKTFDKHLKGLVADGVLERVEEKRTRVFYKLMIPEDSFPKQYIVAARYWRIPLLVASAKRTYKNRELSEFEVEDLIEDKTTSLVRDSLVEAIRLYSKNPAWARYLIDESIELTRSMLNEIVMTLGNDKKARRNVEQASLRLERKRSKRYDAQIRKLRRMDESTHGQTVPNPDFTIDLDKVVGGKSDYACPRCGTSFDPKESHDVVAMKISANNEIVHAIKCNGCNAVIKVEGLPANPFASPKRVQDALGNKKTSKICTENSID
jgi:DNA-binding HxlR family transcriptional regulator